MNTQLRTMKVMVVGTGLAGISLIDRLLDRSVDVTALSNLSQGSSTSISTGMYNPIVFRRLNLSWMVADLLPVMHDFFKKMEVKFGIELIKPIDLAKKIPSDDYYAFWQKRQTEAQYKPFMSPIDDGYGAVLQSGLIDTPSLQASYQAFLREEGILIDAMFEVEAIKFAEHGVEYAGAKYDLICFCEGAYAAENPLFNWLPWNICSGDWVIIKTKHELTDRVLNNKTNIIPMGNCHYKLSSTYGWEPENWDPSSEAVEELIENFKEIFDVEYEIVEHRAALRPSVADRRPYLGRHLEHKSIAIFNGLGSKGVMLAPYYSKHLAEHLLDGKALNKEVDIARHRKRFLNRNEG